MFGRHLESHSKTIDKTCNRNVPGGLSEIPVRELSAMDDHCGSADATIPCAFQFNFHNIVLLSSDIAVS